MFRRFLHQAVRRRSFGFTDNQFPVREIQSSLLCKLFVAWVGSSPAQLNVWSSFSQDFPSVHPSVLVPCFLYKYVSVCLGQCVFFNRRRTQTLPMQPASACSAFLRLLFCNGMYICFCSAFDSHTCYGMWSHLEGRRPKSESCANSLLYSTETCISVGGSIMCNKTEASGVDVELPKNLLSLHSSVQ